LVPVLVDDEQVICDSWAIADHLERTYPDAPSLFGGAAAQSLTRFINDYVDVVVIPGIFRLIASDIVPILHEQDRLYFRNSREKRLGKPLEEFTSNRDLELEAFRKSLEPVRRLLSRQAYLSGETARYADYILFGAFQWARCTSTFELLAEVDLIARWRDRLLDAFDGHARNAPHV
ncbi:MAG: glutathione S-transferase family protein, partial [Betaproteobacteria bacterium]